MSKLLHKRFLKASIICLFFCSLTLKSDFKSRIKLGCGTYGLVFTNPNSPLECTKFIPKANTLDISEEIAIHQKVYQIIKNSRDPYLAVPKFVRTSSNKKFHKIEMERIFSYNGESQLLHLSWNYPSQFSSKDNQGRYLGIQSFEKKYKGTPSVEIIAKKLGAFYGLLHNNEIDAYDMEFVLGKSSSSTQSWKIYGLDFDKSQIIPKASPQKIERKIAERNYETIEGRTRIFARSLSYFPIIKELYEIFSRSYLETRRGQIKEAKEIIAYHKKFISFE